MKGLNAGLSDTRELWSFYIAKEDSSRAVVGRAPWTGLFSARFSGA